MHFFSPPVVLQKLTSAWLHWRVKTNEKKIFLTFDDGPNPGITCEVLAILKDFEARATFFCVGKQVQKHPELFDQILHMQHAVGNHSYSHLRPSFFNPKETLAEIQRCNHVFPATLYRPPYGKIPLTLLSPLAKIHHVVMWSLMSYDYHRAVDAERILNVFTQNTQKGFIWVFHDSPVAFDTVKQVLPALLSYFRKRGYSFEALNNQWLDKKRK